jgi:hypothetical protein
MRKSPSRAELPHLDRSGGRAVLKVDGKLFVVLGAEVQNSSASSTDFMKPIWKRLAGLHCNTVLAPVYWELLEPHEGRYDFSLVKGLLEGARRHGLRLILLWFGTWKNGDSCYAPAWVKRDLNRFPRAHFAPGKNGRNVSPFSAACGEADARAFAKLMRFLRDHDRRRTVIMMQVENEVGHLKSPRDRSTPAEGAFAGPVPPALMKPLVANRDRLIPEFRAAWEKAGAAPGGSWAAVFGEAAPEVFMAWHIARYVERVVSAGKAVYPLPMFVNAWLDYDSPGPGHHPSGGPVFRLHDVWRAAAPSVDAFAPDIYVPDFKRACRDYGQAGNPLLIPETNGPRAEANVFWAVAEHNAICFSPFGIDGPHPWGPVHPWEVPHLPASYRLLGEMLPFLSDYLGTPRIRGILQTSDEKESFDLGDYRIQITYLAKLADANRPGFGLIVATAPDTYVIAGRGISISFLPRTNDRPNVDFISLDEGSFRNGKWAAGRRLNGDDTVGYAVNLPEPKPVVRRAVLYSHD